jgi:hypothetical protein
LGTIPVAGCKDEKNDQIIIFLLPPLKWIGKRWEIPTQKVSNGKWHWLLPGEARVSALVQGPGKVYGLRTRG